MYYIWFLFREDSLPERGISRQLLDMPADGKFKGSQTEDGAVVFRGIVYARYTRFGLPVIVDYGVSEADCGVSANTEVPSGERPAEHDATRYGCVCPQDLSHLIGQLGPDSGLKMREGELCLSVTVPSVTVPLETVPPENRLGFDDPGPSENQSVPSENHPVPSGTPSGLPVMVWIHGGSYLTGGSEDHRYDVSELAEAGKVIVVKISYRLGAAGYLWAPEKGIVNLGLEDQKTALKWILRHISMFGGDPDNVTVWGQSAGAHSVAALIASADDVEPFTNVPRFGKEKFFCRAILQSPPLGVKMRRRDAEKIRSLFLKRLSQRMAGQTDSEGMEAMLKIAEAAQVEDLIAVQTSMKSRHFALPFMPVLPDVMSIPAAGDAGSVAGIPESYVGNSGAPENHGQVGTAFAPPFRVLLYINRDDASVYARKILGDKLYRTPLGTLLTKIITAVVFSFPVRKYLKKLRKRGVEATLFRFSWHPKGSALGCCHSIELPFLLGHREDWSGAEMLQGITEEEFDYYSERFKTRWTEFARCGKFPKEIS